MADICHVCRWPEDAPDYELGTHEGVNASSRCKMCGHRRPAMMQPMFLDSNLNPVIEPSVEVELFKPNGKYYTTERWRIPAGAIGPTDMARSQDFRRIDGGPVFVTNNSPWGFPTLIL